MLRKQTRICSYKWPKRLISGRHSLECGLYNIYFTPQTISHSVIYWYSQSILIFYSSCKFRILLLFKELFVYKEWHWRSEYYIKYSRKKYYINKSVDISGVDRGEFWGFRLIKASNSQTICHRLHIDGVHPPELNF